MAPVRIIDVSYIAAPSPAANAPPPEPIKINAMEAQWVGIPLLQHLLIFEGVVPPFDAVLRSLKSSLAATLAAHAPLAGKLHHLAGTGDVAILWPSPDGVRFVAAESDADARRLAGDEEHDGDTFERLVPELDASVLPAPLLAVQATRLGGGGGGVALGITAHHAVADGRSLWRFVEAWAAACRGDAPPAPPVFDRSRASMPGGDELARSVLRKYTPNLPVASLPPSVLKEEDRMRFCRRTFTLDAQHIERLKQRIVGVGEAHGAPSRRPLSIFVAIVTLAWTCFARCRPFAADEDMFLFFFADVRGRLDPPAGDDYFGACITACLARLPARELRGERALAAAAAAVQGAVEEMAEDPLGGGWPGWEFIRVPGAVPMDRLMNVSGSSGFRAYEVADFGWGRPRRTENVRMNHDGQVALVRARDGRGVQVSVAMLQRAHMDAFKSDFLGLLG